MLEILEKTVRSHQLELLIHHRKLSTKGWPLYTLEVLIDQQHLYEHDQSFNSFLAKSLFKEGLSLLDQWCISHPHSFLATYNWTIADFYKILFKWGAACDGRIDTWFTCINDQGQRVLYPGVLNLIEDCLNFCDLWRVAKDTNYYLGYLETPVDLLNSILSRAGCRNLLEDSYALNGDYAQLFLAYQARMQFQQCHELLFKQHPVGDKPIYIVQFIPQSPDDQVELHFFYGMRFIAALTPQVLRIKLHQKLNQTIQASEVNQLAEQILCLNPSQAEGL